MPSLKKFKTKDLPKQAVHLASFARYAAELSQELMGKTILKPIAVATAPFGENYKGFPVWAICFQNRISYNVTCILKQRLAVFKTVEESWKRNK